jgi:pSer/pThr/pTyr-binding forkhead associated (FHA) protein
MILCDARRPSMKISLVMATSDGEGRRFELRKDRVIIGREVRCDLRVCVPTVESRHCEVRIEREVVRLVDLGSQSGTFHNGERVREAVLRQNDELVVGPARFRIMVEPKPDPLSSQLES